jgi:CxxC motif-containing protein (DUF1111 family)
MLWRRAGAITTMTPAIINPRERLILAGQRVFFLHDGRTNNLLTAIEQHASSGSEANQVISAFNMLSTADQQNILNFLRDL